MVILHGADHATREESTLHDGSADDPAQVVQILALVLSDGQPTV